MNNTHTAFDPSDRRTLERSGIAATIASSPDMRFDSEEDASLYFARELDYVKGKTYDRIYPELTALSMFPVTHEVPEGAETVTYYGYNKRGLAKVIANYADDLPRADVAGQPKTAHVKGLGDSYGYSVQDMRASRLAGKGLDARRGEAARYAIDRLTNTIAWKGDPDNNLVGVLSEDNDIPLYTLATGAQGSKTTWSSKNIDEIIADVSGMLAQVNLATQNTEHPDTLAIPSDTYTELSLKRIPETATSALKYLQDNLNGIQIVSCAELNTTATDTNPYAAKTDGKGVALLYTKNKDKLSIEVPMPFYQHPAQNRNLEVVIPCESRVFGAMIYYPLSAIIAVGV